MKQPIDQVKSDLAFASDRLVAILNATPDDKLNWSPSPTARTPIEVGAHAALSIGYIQQVIEGKPFPFQDTDEMHKAARAEEKQFKTKDQVFKALKENSDGYVKFLDTLTPEQLAAEMKTPFGTFPVAAAIHFPGGHLRGHVAQIEYIQTIYGDQDWHMKG